MPAFFNKKTQPNNKTLLPLLFSDSGGTRTPNLQNRNLTFYPVELRSLFQ